MKDTYSVVDFSVRSAVYSAAHSAVGSSVYSAVYSVEKDFMKNLENEL